MPNGMPSFDKILIAAMLGVSGIYFLSKIGSSPKEVTYMEFVNDYLTKSRVSMITVSEDQTNETFKYKIKVECNDGSKVQLVLPQIDNFLYKLDLV